MNIFKVLANGDGSINEANVSAFLGYLLDPKADHALGFEFLKLFLEPVLDGEDFDIDKYDYQIFYEQAFREGSSSKQIVDVVIVCYSTEQGTGKESFVKEFLKNNKTVERLFLIENKIRAGSMTTGQLMAQFQSSVSELKGDLEEEQIYSIYVTPEDDKLSAEFEQASSINPTHILWDSIGSEVTTIKSMLKEILQRESQGDAEALNEYTNHTIKAFIQFIATDFRSEKEDEKKRREPGQNRLDAIELNKTHRIEEKLHTLRNHLIYTIPGLSKEISTPDLSKPSHPKLQIKRNGILLQIASNSRSRDKVGFWFTIDRDSEKSRKQLELLAKRLGIIIKKPKVTYGSYCKTEEMKTARLFSNPDRIAELVRSCLNLIEEHLG